MVAGGIFGVIFGGFIAVGLLLLDNLAPSLLDGYSRHQLSFVCLSALCVPFMGFFFVGVPAGIVSAIVVTSLMLNLEASGSLPAAFKNTRLIAAELAIVAFPLAFLLLVALSVSIGEGGVFTTVLQVTFSIAIALGIGIISARTLRSYARAYPYWQADL